MRVNPVSALTQCILAAIPLLLIAGCKQSSGSPGLNDTAADIQQKLTEAEKKVEDAIEWPPDEAKKKVAHETFRDAVVDARRRFDEVKVPDGEAGKKFHDGFNNYLKIQEDAAKLYKRYFETSETKEEKGVDVRDDLAKMRDKRRTAASQLPGLQQAYAKEAGFQLKK